MLSDISKNHQVRKQYIVQLGENELVLKVRVITFFPFLLCYNFYFLSYEICPDTGVSRDINCCGQHIRLAVVVAKSTQLVDLTTLIKKMVHDIAHLLLNYVSFMLTCIFLHPFSMYFKL